MSTLEIRDLYLQQTKDSNGNLVDKAELWDAVALDIEVDAGDYRVVRSKVGRYLIYTVKYDSVEDASFKENPTDPNPPAGTVPKRWNKIYRCWFDLNYVKAANTKPISNEEKYTYPALPPEEISNQTPPAGQTWAKDPFYRLYKNYKYPDPTPDPTLKECDKKYVGEYHVFIQKLVSLLTKVDIEQFILAPNEPVPVPPPAGQTESPTVTAKRLKNYIKLHSIKDTLRATYQILTVGEQLDPNTNQTACQTAKTEDKKITLRSLGCTDENKDDYEVVDLPIVRF